MNIVETGKILTFASGHDRFISVDEVTTNAWLVHLADISYDHAFQATRNFYETWDGKSQLTVAYILRWVKEATRTAARDIAIDVRSARARGLIAQDWDETTALPPDIAQKLADARAADREQGRGLGTVETSEADQRAWLERNREWLSA